MSISNFLPYKMLSSIRTSNCASCDKLLTDLSIIATGVRKLESGINVPYVEYLCDCGHRGIAIFTEDKEYDLYSFCYEIITNLANKRQMERSKFLEHKHLKSPMTSAEIDNFIKFVKESDNHEEFLKHIGSEIEENDES